jgi:L-aminopeptidase/D-esterase-like protein
MEILTSELEAMEGVGIGHWTDARARTGCTVIRFDTAALTAVDVRGAAPGSRELDLLQPGRTVRRVDAILLTGGSAMGLAAADGVVRWMRERGRGYRTSAGSVPIVPAAVLFDLATGTTDAPDADAGYAATALARSIPEAETGRCGAGTGATTGKIRGTHLSRAGGLAVAQVRLDEGSVTAVVAVNAYGELQAVDHDDPRIAFLSEPVAPVPLGESTTLMACITDLSLNHEALMRLTVAMHDGLARKIVPVHTSADGDIAFASTTAETQEIEPGQSLRACLAAELAVETAIDSLRTST